MKAYQVKAIGILLLAGAAIAWAGGWIGGPPSTHSADPQFVNESGNTIRPTVIADGGSLNVNVTSGVAITGTAAVNPAAQTTAKTTMVIVENVTDGGCTTVPASSLSGRRAIELQNQGPNSIWCKLGATGTDAGVCPIGAGDGREIVADGIWAMDVSDSILVQCWAQTASQVDGGATCVNEVK